MTRVLAAALIVLSAQNALSQVLPYAEEAILLDPTPSSGAPSANFGLAVAVSGDRAVIGTPGAWQGSNNTGEAHVFVRSGSTWTHEAALLPDSTARGFGQAVDIDGDSVVVGAPLGAEAVYVYTRTGTTWSLEQRITASGDNEFGSSVVISSDRIAVGSHRTPVGANPDAGRVFTYERSGGVWTAAGAVSASDPLVYSLFGRDVSLDGDTLAVGVGTPPGAAHVFVRGSGTWISDGVVLPPAGAPGSFGSKVAASGSGSLIVGGSFAPTSVPSPTTVAYAYARGTDSWALEDELVVPKVSDAYLGNGSFASLALSEDMAVIGAPWDGQTYLKGRVFVFVRSGTTWMFHSSFTGSGVGGNDAFAWDVSVDGSALVAGAWRAGNMQGAAYTFEVLPIGLWSDLGMAVTSQVGTPTLSANGYLLDGSTLTLGLANARPFSPAPLIVGLSPIYASFGGGTLVPFPDLMWPLFTDGTGADDFSVVWPSNVPSGFTFYVQWWVVDPTGPQGYAASNALSAVTP